MLKINLVWAVGYYCVYHLAPLFCLPPYQALPLWPAAGLAFAGVFAYGTRILPGLGLGALLGEIYKSHLFCWPDAPPALALATAALSALAAVLQAYAGVWLLRRRAAAGAAILTEDTQIFRFVLLSGFIGCAIYPAFVHLSALPAHAGNWRFLLLNWAIDWGGNVIGVLIIAPVALCFIGKPRCYWRMRVNTVALPAAMLFLLIGIIFQFTKNQEYSRLKSRFDEHVNVYHRALQSNLDRQIEINESFKALFDGSEAVQSDDFRNFARTLIASHPSIKALEWIPMLTADNYQYYRQTSPEIFPVRDLEGDELTPANEAPVKDYFPVVYSEPAEVRAADLGLDLSSEPLRNQALRLAIDTFATTATGLIHLPSDPEKHPAVRFFTPVYRHDKFLDNPVMRRQHATGLISSAFIIKNKIKEVRSQLPDLQLRLSVTDGPVRLYDELAGGVESARNVAGLQKRLDLAVANRTWTVTYMPTLLFSTRQLSEYVGWLLITGMLFAGLSSCFLLILTGRTLRIEELVRLRTRELKKESRKRQAIISQHAAHNRILQVIASPAPLSDVLSVVLDTVKSRFPRCRGCILLLNEQRRFQVKSDFGLPFAVTEALSRLRLDPDKRPFERVEAAAPETYQDLIFGQNIGDALSEARLTIGWAEPIVSAASHVTGLIIVFHEGDSLQPPLLQAALYDLAQLATIAIERKSAEKQIAHLAYYDALTNLPNRRLFFSHLEKALASALRYQTYAALLYLDLDHFKTLNDALGHDIGDELLIEVAERLKSCIRNEDTVARLGGDEFVLLLSTRETARETATAYVLTTAERVRATLEAPYHLKKHIHHITPSIGITLMPQPGITAGELLKQADTAMYHAKNRGRNSISFYSEEMQKRADKRLVLEKDLRTALAEKQFSLHYQPQFDSCQRLIGAEALIRWRHPVKGMISPAEFIPVAEETGLILTISEWVVQEACMQLQKWPKLPHLAINISPKQFRQPEFETQIADNLLKYDVKSSRLMLEITEGSIIEDIDDSIKKLQSMQNLGIDISIDDFGTGYSSLAYLKLLPLNQLKIDQSFVRDIIIDNNDAVIVETIIAMAKHLGLTVIAEGVETAEQMQFLHDRKCKGYQGYFFSKPLTAEDFASQFISRLEAENVQ